MSEKVIRYAALVKERKSCRRCAELFNPSMVEGGRYDSDEIGPYSLWEGNLDAPVLMVAQDWGPVQGFTQLEGIDPPYSRPRTTNANLPILFRELGISIHPPGDRSNPRGQKVFFANAMQCLKPGKDFQSKVDQRWFHNCGYHFLRPLIEIIQPNIIIALGEKAYSAVSREYDLRPGKFKDAVAKTDGFILKGGIRLFPVYHCGARVVNKTRSLESQQKDWGKIRKYLGSIGIAGDLLP